jgi:RNA polymerase sigma-70 factor (ECF subfamily)
MTTWLTAIVINAARMTLRRRSPRAQTSLAETHGERSVLLAEMLPDHQPNPEEVCCRRELAEKLADATTQLSPTLRTTFQLRNLDGLSIRETAHLLGVPSSIVKARLARARVTLKEIMSKSLRGKVMPPGVCWLAAIHKKRPKRSYGSLQLADLWNTGIYVD